MFVEHQIINTGLHVRVCANIRTHTPANAHARTRTCTCSRTRAHMRVRAHMHTRARLQFCSLQVSDVQYHKIAYDAIAIC
jgi:hypothetical protein